MSVFGAYSHYYNLLYQDKDYHGETDYVHGLIRKYHPTTQNILDLGCGTGRHDILLAEKGYRITGVDFSDDMLAVARSASSTLTFHQGDIRTIRLGEKFDAVISLFHVMSYQTTNDDLASSFATVREHLNPGGVFIFDCWYGPAVLSEPPVIRIKRLEDEKISVLRIAEPVMHPNENLVDVNYHVIVRVKTEGKDQDLRETHRMRYLFRPELDFFLRDAGLRIVDEFEWITNKPPGLNTWGVCFVVKN